MTNDEFYGGLLERLGWSESDNPTAGDSMENDLAGERADAVLAFMERVKGSALPGKLVPVSGVLRSS